ncbi:Insect odorant-binding protein A10/Ejaculatory bulb-specific protein 3 [Cinara cedri]|uniref:Insect odorant-binding protein A10/Ejaculatory bulb-specific protein 3 n=1 Tax=Cinara cedri TaxID=506608 RepID=A0A5E4M4M6_9HEMI|nr:Insect odorant-binding protein A10/Ejaculatory bulb-specific protein 3 [Cinara cedri]
MNILTVFFCYITVTCDTDLGPQSPAPAVNAPNSKKDATQPTTGTDNRISVRQTATYPTRYDYMDVDAVMSNERMIKMLFNCVMGRGRCTREGLELKRIIPDAIQTECAKCNEQQKKQAGRVLAYLLNKKPDLFQMLIKRFDPDDIHLRKYMADENENEEDRKLVPQKLTNDTIVNNT